MMLGRFIARMILKKWSQAAKRKPIGGGARGGDKYSDSLSSLGIEFAGSQQEQKPFAERKIFRPQVQEDVRPAISVSAPSPKEGQFVLRQEKAPFKSISLSELKSRSHFDRENIKKGPDLKGLREALQDIVKGGDKEGEK